MDAKPTTNLDPEALTDDQIRNATRFLENLYFGIELNHMTDPQVAEKLFTEVWQNLNINSRESAIVGEAIFRLRGGQKEGGE